MTQSNAKVGLSFKLILTNYI